MRPAAPVAARLDALARAAAPPPPVPEGPYLVAGMARAGQAAVRICTLTWACSPAPVGFNDHANTRGYRAIADTVLDAVGDRSL